MCGAYRALAANAHLLCLSWSWGLEHADRSGFLDAKELQKALAMGNLHYGLTDVDQVQSHG